MSTLDDIVRTLREAAAERPRPNVIYAPGLAERMAAIVREEVEAAGGCISEAARRLGVHRRTLQRWLNDKAPQARMPRDGRR
jgi:excisionase family DNA binding protein